MSGDSADPRVYLPADKEEVLTFLYEKGPFETRAAVVAFAAALGYGEGRRVPVEKGGKDIRWGIFQEEGKAFIADLIAAVNSDELSIMRDERGSDRRQIFAEYANGGLALLRDRVMDKPRDPSDVILELVFAFEAPRPVTSTDGLGRLIAEMEGERRGGAGGD
jgi:dnd system-associated protein 4